MGRKDLEVLSGGVIKRRVKRRMGLFIDAAGLDRATRRMDKKIDLSRLVSGLASGIKSEISRYYCLIPYEDDARQFSFLDAVHRAGIEVITKRLPPKGVNRHVSMDVHIASDLISFAYGSFAKASALTTNEAQLASSLQVNAAQEQPLAVSKAEEIERIATIVCPSRELGYAIFTANSLGVETCLADFGLYGQSDGWKGVSRWIDLSTSETIWR